MANKRLVINKWYGGISNDPNAGSAGSSYNIEGVDIFTNSKDVRLSKGNYLNSQLINTRNTNGKIIASLYENTTNYLELSYDGYLTGLVNNDTNNGPVIKGTLGNGCNIGKITIGSGATYGFLITTSNFSKWVYDANNPPLGTYVYGSNGINTDYSFDLGTGWTIGANWSIASSKATHTIGSTAVLSRVMTSVSGDKYRVRGSAQVTAGSCVVKVAGNTIFTFSSSTNNIAQVGFYTSASTTDLLEFIPTTDFDGYIENLYVQTSNIVSTAKTFNSIAPYIIFTNRIFIGNGNKITEVDMTTGTPVITDSISIDYDYTIRAITRIGDQFYIYASNGSNGRRYTWDGASTTFDYSVTYTDKPILNVANIANVDYVITGTTRRQQISIVNGYQLQPLMVTKDYTNEWERLYFYNEHINAIETIGNRVIFGTVGGIYSFGVRTPGLPNALVKEWVNSGDEITSISYSEGASYSIFYYFRGTINGVLGNYRVQVYLPEGNNNEKFATIASQETGWIETNHIYGEVFSNEKHLIKYTIGCRLQTDTQINTYIGDTYYANIYTTGSSLGYSIGDVYTYSGRTFTITSITYRNSGYILHCSYTGTELIGRLQGTFTKSSGSGPSTFVGDKIRYGFRLLDSITDTTKNRFSNQLTGTSNEHKFAFELISTNELYTPELYDFNLYYDEINNG